MLYKKFRIGELKRIAPVKRIGEKLLNILNGIITGIIHGSTIDLWFAMRSAFFGSEETSDGCTKTRTEKNNRNMRLSVVYVMSQIIDSMIRFFFSIRYWL